MDGNKLTLLNVLLEANDYITYEALAENLGVSTRTILRLMKDIQSYIAQYHIQIEMKKRKGVRLQGSEAAYIQLREALTTTDSSSFTSSERMILIMIELFTNPDYTKIYYLAYTLNVSITTIQHDLSAIENYLTLNHLEVKNQRGQGIKLAGNRKDILWAIAGFLSPYIEWGEDHIRYTYMLSPHVQKQMEDFFSLAKLQQVKQLVDAFDYTVSRVFVLEDYHHFLILNSIMIFYQTYVNAYPEAIYDERIQTHQVHLRYHEFMKKVNRELRISSLSDTLGNLYTCAYLAMRKIDTQMDAYQYDEELYYLTLHFLADVEQELQVSLNRDANLIDRLALHMKLVINRVTMGTLINNTYLEEVKKKYLPVFEAVKHHLYLLEGRYAIQINDNEIGYITIHVLATMMEQENQTRNLKAAVLCMSGMGTSKMLMETIRLRYPLLDMACTLSLDDFHECKLLQEGYDLLISTIAMDTITLPCVVVHPIMKEHDFKKLNQVYEQLLTKRHYAEEPYDSGLRKKQESLRTATRNMSKQMILHRLQLLYQIVDQFAVYDVSCASFDELITCIAAQEIAPALREEFMNKIYLREQLGSTIINTLDFILIHCRLEEMVTLKLYRLAKRFSYAGEAQEQGIQYALVMIAPTKDDPSLLDMLSQVSMSVAMDEALQRVLCSGTEDEIIPLLIDCMDKR